MIRRIVIFAVFLALSLANAMAQNSIDKLVDNYASIGSSSFTSAVERDPKTLKVKKVVNVLKLSHMDISKFVSAFKRESEGGDFTEKYDSEGYSMILTVRKPAQNRIYMLRGSDPYYPGRRDTKYSQVKITIIVNYK